MARLLGYVVCFVTLPRVSLCPLLSCHLSAFSLFVSHTTLSLGTSRSRAKPRGWRGEAPHSAFMRQWAGPATLRAWSLRGTPPLIQP